MGLACGVVRAAGLAPPSIRASRPRRSLTTARRSGSPRVRGAGRTPGGGGVPGAEGTRQVASRRPGPLDTLRCAMSSGGDHMYAFIRSLGSAGSAGSAGAADAAEAAAAGAAGAAGGDSGFFCLLAIDRQDVATKTRAPRRRFRRQPRRPSPGWTLPSTYDINKGQPTFGRKARRGRICEMPRTRRPGLPPCWLCALSAGHITSPAWLHIYGPPQRVVLVGLK